MNIQLIILCLILISTNVWAVKSPTAGDLIILQYHHIDHHTPHSTSTRPNDFIEHLKLIQKMGLPVVDLPAALDELFKKGRLKQTSVAITFDDGFQSVYTQAFPELKKRGWPFTIFVNPQLASFKSSLFLNWQQLKELKNQGASIANHGMTHAYLLNKPKKMSWDDWLYQEVEQAQHKIEKQLGSTPKILAYAYGEFNSEITRWLAQNGYRALGQHSGPINRYSHQQALARFPAGGSHSNPKKLKQKLKTLAAAIDHSQWKNPIIQDNPPLLKLTLTKDDLNTRSIQCYSNSEGAIPTLTHKENGRIIIKTHNQKAIKRRRDRYNCSIQSLAKPSHYYWYSQLWINTSITTK